MTSHVKTLILDLGGVLLDWNPQSINAFSLSQLRLIMYSTVRHGLDRCHLSLDQACELSCAYLVFRNAELKIYQQFSVMIGVKASVVKGGLERAIGADHSRVEELQPGPASLFHVEHQSSTSQVRA